MSEAHGLVVVLDDLHWADEATLALLSFLSRHVPRSRVLIVGGFRDIDASTPLVRLTGSVEVVTLAGLADEEAADLADAVAAGRLATDGVADVVRRAGGNPLFVRELTRLVAAGRSSSGEPVHVPGGVRELVAQRLARLSPACRAMLDIAAVAGAEVRLDVLARTSSGHDDLPDLVDEAVRARILVTSRDELAPLGFAHDLFREVLSAMLSPAIKAQLHLTLARTLDQLRADGIPIAHASVAAHYVAAASLGLRPAARRRSGTPSRPPSTPPASWPSKTPPATCAGRSPRCSSPSIPPPASASTCCSRWVPRSITRATPPEPARCSSRQPISPASSATPTASPGPPSAPTGWVR